MHISSHTRNLDFNKNLSHAAVVNIELHSGLLIDTLKGGILKGQLVAMLFPLTDFKDYFLSIAMNNKNKIFILFSYLLFLTY